MKDISWPKKGENPFLVKYADPDSPTLASLSWLASFDFNDSFFSNAFKEAADKIIKELSKGGEHERAEIFFIPIAYLYRHSLELKMKHFIKVGIDLGLLQRNDEKLQCLLENHKLHQLWNYVRRILESFWPDAPKDVLDAAGRIIQEFHKIDKSGQGLRYSEDLLGNKTMDGLPQYVELEHLKKTMDAIFNFWEGCEAGFDHAIEIKNDMLREYNY